MYIEQTRLKDSLKHVLLIITVILVLLSFAFAERDNSCGNTLWWDLNENGVLTITGQGAMENYSLYENQAPWYNHSDMIESVTIGEGVTSIGSYAFAYCTELKQVTLPSSLITIGTGAFESCSSMQTIIFPDQLVSVGSKAFNYCTELRTITIPVSLISIEERAFSGCFALTDFYVTNGNPAYKSIEGVLFSYDATEIIYYPSGRAGSYTIPNGVTSVSSNAFYYCSGLTEIHFPQSIISIGNSAFQSCNGLSTVIFNDGLKDIGESAFCYCTGLREITLPNSVENISNGTFRGCSALKSILIPRSSMSIGSFAFYGCSNLDSLIIENGVTSIGESAFYNCGNLKRLTLPVSINSIGDKAFYYCTNLEKVTIHNPNVFFGMKVFYGCSSRLFLYGISNSTTYEYALDNNCKFESITYSMEEPDFVFPENLTSIEAESLSGSKAMVVLIPDSVTSIGSRAFANCSKLVQIRIPASITIIPLDIFENIPVVQITIFGERGSAAENFANALGILFIGE